MADAIADNCDLGTTNASARLVIMTSGDVEVATLEMSNPAFSMAVNGVITAAAITADTNATGGTAALFKITDRDNGEIYRGSVGTFGEDLNLSSLSIGVGDVVSVSSLVYSAAV